MPLKKLQSIEPFRPNCWILSFPDEFGIQEFTTSKVSELKYTNDKGWKKVKISMFDLIGQDTTKKLLDNINRVPIKVTLKKLDLTGACIEKIQIFSKKISVNFGKFDYASDDLSLIKVMLNPTKVLIS